MQLGCQFCQNHNISKARDIVGREFNPEEVVRIAIENGVDGIAYTYNEPSIFIEYALDVARLARKRGLFNVFVTNGYMTEEDIACMEGVVDAAVVNFKGNGEQKFANKFEVVMSSEPIKETLVRLKDAGIHIEITDLIIPHVGDSIEACDELTGWISKTLGADTPVHFTRFHPDYKMLDYPLTPLDTLKSHYEAARKNGLRYAYVGNVHGNDLESTYCGNCGKIAVKRDGYRIGSWDLGYRNRCRGCGTAVPIVGRFNGRYESPEIISLY